MQKILKGWCSGLKGVAKILNMDFIHTAAGDPVYIKHLDNFNDLRERFVEVIDGFRKIMKCDKKVSSQNLMVDAKKNLLFNKLFLTEVLS